MKRPKKRQERKRWCTNHKQKCTRNAQAYLPVDDTQLAGEMLLPPPFRHHAAMIDHLQRAPLWLDCSFPSGREVRSITNSIGRTSAPLFWSFCLDKLLQPPVYSSEDMRKILTDFCLHSLVSRSSIIYSHFLFLSRTLSRANEGPLLLPGRNECAAQNKSTDSENTNKNKGQQKQP